MIIGSDRILSCCMFSLAIRAIHFISSSRKLRRHTSFCIWRLWMLKSLSLNVWWFTFYIFLRLSWNNEKSIPIASTFNFSEEWKSIHHGHRKFPYNRISLYQVFLEPWLDMPKNYEGESATHFHFWCWLYFFMLTPLE